MEDPWEAKEEEKEKMTHKLVKDVNEETWRKFVAYCKIKDVKVGNELDKLLKDCLKKNLSKLFN